MEYIEIANWNKFQHYKERNPPWIKLYSYLLDDDDFDYLPDASKMLYFCLILFASRRDNKIRFDLKWLQKKLPIEEKLTMKTIQPLIEAGFIERKQDASTPIAGRKQNAIPEKRREEAENSREDIRGSGIVSEIKDYWNSKKSLQSIRAMTPKRIIQVNTRLKEEQFKDNWKIIIDKVASSPFCTGSTGWKAGFDWLIKNKDNYTKVLEGNYDERRAIPAGKREPKQLTAETSKFGFVLTND